MAKRRTTKRGPSHVLGPRLDLVTIRKAVGVTQAELAETMNLSQGDISKFEHRDDMKVSSMKRYVEALGGELHLVVVFPSGHQMRLEY